MPILYTVVARNSTILAKYSDSGNFDEVVIEVLKRNPSDSTKHSYQYIENIINFIIEDNVFYICITNQNYDRTLSFQFLESIKNRFKAKYGNLIQTALPFSMNSDFSKIIANLMSEYNNEKVKLNELEENVDNLTKVMQSNLRKAVERSENLDNMASASETLYNNAQEFSRASVRVRRQYFCRNVKTTVLIGIGVGVILIIVIALIVWKFKKNSS